MNWNLNALRSETQLKYWVTGFWIGTVEYLDLQHTISAQQMISRVDGNKKMQAEMNNLSHSALILIFSNICLHTFSLYI